MESFVGLEGDFELVCLVEYREEKRKNVRREATGGGSLGVAGDRWLARRGRSTSWMFGESFVSSLLVCLTDRNVSSSRILIEVGSMTGAIDDQFKVHESSPSFRKNIG